MNMNAYKIKYPNGDYKIVTAKTALEVIKKYDLATRENINTRVIQLEGEQKAIALSNIEETPRRYRLTRAALDRIRREKRERAHHAQYREIEAGVFIKVR